MRPAALSTTRSSALLGPLPPRRALGFAVWGRWSRSPGPQGRLFWMYLMKLGVVGMAQRRDASVAPVPGLPLQRQGAHPVSCSAQLWLLLTAQGIRVGWGGVGPLRRGRETTVSLRPASRARVTRLHQAARRATMHMGADGACAGLGHLPHRRGLVVEALS